MARIFLDVDERFTVSGDDDQVIGRSGAETVLIASGVTGTELDGNIERVDIAANAAEATLQVNDEGRFEVVSGNDVLATVTGGLNQAVELRFADGNARLAQTGATAFALSSPGGAQDAVTIARGSAASGDAVALGASLSAVQPGGNADDGGSRTSGPIYFDGQPVFSDAPDRAQFVEVGRDETPATLRLADGETLAVSGEDASIRVSPGSGYQYNDPTAAPPLSESLLEIVNGSRARVETDGFGGLQLGGGTNGNGRAVVSGEGSGLSLVGEDAGPSIAPSGRGELTVTDGAVLEVLTPDGDTVGSGITIADRAGSEGELVLRDAALDIRDTDGLVDSRRGEYGNGPYMDVGRGGSGQVDLLSGSTVTLEASNTSLVLGRQFDGSPGSGTMTITEDSVLRMTTRPENTDLESDFVLEHYAAVGRDGGDGELNITDGGVFEMVGRNQYATLELGRAGDGSVAGTGRVLVSGADSRLEVRNEKQNGEGFIGVGRDGTGTLIVEEGATLVGGPFLSVGDRAGGDGTYTLTGEGTSAALNGQARFEDGPLYGAFFTVANNANATGTATITDGASMTINTQTGTFPGLQIADGADTVGELTISGAGSSLTIEGNGGPLSGETAYVEIGAAGSAALTIAEGGSLVQDPNGIVAVGTEAGGSGRVEVTGDGSLLDAGGVMVIGAPTLLDEVVRGDIALTGGGEGQVTVGSGATLRAGAAEGDGVDDIFIGEQGTLRIEDGGTVAADVVNDAGGTLVTGNSPGWARVDGDLDWRGDLAMEFAGAGESAYDRLDITGEATIDGLITLDFSLDEGLRTGDQFAVIETAQGLDLDGADIAITGLAGTLEARTTITDTALQVELV